MSTWRTLITRTQPAIPTSQVITGAVSGGILIALLGIITALTGQPLLAAAFGSSAALIFLLPGSPLSQPINVVGGHVVSATVGLVVRSLLPNTWWSIAIAVALSLALMGLLRITHPPAGGTPIVIITTGAGWSYLLLPILLGAAILALGGIAYRALLARQQAAAQRAKTSQTV